MGLIIVTLIVGFFVYFYLSRHTRRDHAIENRIRKMLSIGIKELTFHELYFEAASSYAYSKKDKELLGKNIEKNRTVDSCNTEINGKNYYITFFRENNGGTTINIEDSCSVKSLLENPLDWDPKKISDDLFKDIIKR